MITFPTDLASARSAFAEITTLVGGFERDQHRAALNESQMLIVDRQPCETGAYLLHRHGGQPSWHLTVWLETGDFQIWIDTDGPSRFHSAGNVKTGRLSGELARKAAA